jgi:hypothetical protein
MPKYTVDITMKVHTQVEIEAEDPTDAAHKIANPASPDWIRYAADDEYADIEAMSLEIMPYAAPGISYEEFQKAEATMVRVSAEEMNELINALINSLSEEEIERLKKRPKRDPPPG